MTIDIALGKLGTPEYTKDVFLSEFRKHLELLLDSRRFEKECKNLNLDPVAVGTDVVYDGITKVELVLKNGIESEYYGRYKEMEKALFTLAELDNATYVTVPEEKALSTPEN